MTEDKDALIQRYRRTREALLAAIDGLSDAQMTEETLDGWSVKDHLAHLAHWDDIRTGEVMRISAGHESAWRMTEDQVIAHNALAHELTRGLSLEQVRWELTNSRQRFMAALKVATPRGLDGSLYGDAALVSGHEAEHTAWIARWRQEHGY